MKRLLLHISLSWWLVGVAIAQCPVGDPEPNCNLLVPNTPGVVNLANNLTVGTGVTAVFPGTNPNPQSVSNFTLNGGTVIVCSGILNLLDINFGQGGGKLIVNSDASMTVRGNSNNPILINSNNQVKISVYGFLLFRRRLSVLGGVNANHTIYIGQSGLGVFTERVMLNSPSAAFIVDGIADIDDFVINNGTVCMGQDAVIDVQTLENNTSEPILVPAGIGSACISITSSISSSQPLTASPNLNLCLSQATLPPSVNVGAAQVSLGCNDCLELLPIQLLAFQGVSRGVANLLRWVVAPGSTFASVTVEKSADGRTFQAAGPALLPHAEPDDLVYQFTDFNPFPRITYYRLRVLDTDGTVDYSRVLTLAGSAETSGLTLYPNPVEGEGLTYSLGGLTAGNCTIEVINMAGQVVYREAVTVGEGSLSATLNLSTLPSGLYWFRAQTRQQHFHKKFVINR